MRRTVGPGAPGPSGTFDPRKLDEWVRLLELEMRRLCGREAHCWVRHRNPLGWAD